MNIGDQLTFEVDKDIISKADWTHGGQCGLALAIKKELDTHFISVGTQDGIFALENEYCFFDIDKKSTRKIANAYDKGRKNPFTVVITITKVKNSSY